MAVQRGLPVVEMETAMSIMAFGNWLTLKMVQVQLFSVHQRAYRLVIWVVGWAGLITMVRTLSFFVQ